MAKPATIRTAGTLAATLLFAAATDGFTVKALARGQEATVSQVQLGDIFTQQTLNVDSAANGSASAATSVGNSAIATGSGTALIYQGTQEINAEIGAKTNVSVGGSSGPSLYAQSAATGNTATSGTCCATTTGSATQSIDPYHGVSAETYVYNGGYTGTVAADAAAIGNTQGWEQVNGAVASSTTQTHYGTTAAQTAVNVAAADTGAYTATAVANNVTTDADNSSTDQTVSQTQDGYLTQAAVQANQGWGGDVTAAATATANNINVVADGGIASLNADQLSTKPVNATATVSLDSWGGSATSTAYGVANGAMVTNTGAATAMNVTQNSIGPVTVTASLTGGAGGDGFVSATGGVNVSSSLNAGSVSSAGGTASAVGNTASFIVHN
jgi:hypothetical protein